MVEYLTRLDEGKATPRRMTVIVPAVIYGVLRLEAAKFGFKPYYLVTSALAAWTGRCSICGEQIDVERAGDDILVRCEKCEEAGFVPDRNPDKRAPQNDDHE